MWRRVAVQMSVSCVLLLACVAVSDPLEVGTDSVPVQVSADLKVQMGRSDAPMAALRPGSGDSLGAADSFQLYQLGLKAESQYRNLSGKVDLLTTAAPQAWVDYFTAHSLWVREASLTWSQPWGKLSAGRLQYDFGFGVEANADLIPQTGVRFDTRIRGFDVTWLRTDVPDGTNLNPQFVQLFGGYARSSEPGPDWSVSGLPRVHVVGSNDNAWCHACQPQRTVWRAQLAGRAHAVQRRP